MRELQCSGSISCCFTDRLRTGEWSRVSGCVKRCWNGVSQILLVFTLWEKPLPYTHSLLCITHSSRKLNKEQRKKNYIVKNKLSNFKLFWMRLRTTALELRVSHLLIYLFLELDISDPIEGHKIYFDFRFFVHREGFWSRSTFDHSHKDLWALV